jgi:hypothetical protein
LNSDIASFIRVVVNIGFFVPSVFSHSTFSHSASFPVVFSSAFLLCSTSFRVFGVHAVSFGCAFFSLIKSCILAGSTSVLSSQSTYLFVAAFHALMKA